MINSKRRAAFRKKSEKEKEEILKWALSEAKKLLEERKFSKRQFSNLLKQIEKDPDTAARFIKMIKKDKDVSLKDFF